VEIKVPVSELAPGDVIVTRPGEAIAVDGVVIEGHASVDEAAISGESIPVEKIVGKNVYSASILINGTLKIKATAVGEDSTFGQIIRLVEEAEANRGDVQRYADKFAAWYLPIVAGIALITYAIRRDPISAAAVMVVACSCSFSLATPVAMLAAIGNSAKDGLLFKGGKYVEELSSADTVLIDKTGTLTIGKPHITDIVTVKGTPKKQLIFLCASAERYSEHPLADAVLEAAQNASVPLFDSDQFNNLPGRGVEAIINTDKISVLNKPLSITSDLQDIANNLISEGKTLLFIHKNDMLIGLMAAEDTLREETKDALTELRSLGIDRIELISGDNEAAVKKIADILAIDYQSEMKPEEKIALVRQMQANGKRVVMVGDGINDAPALAQADIGIAMGHSGTQIASESAHIVLMREDWGLVPDAIKTARRTMRVVKTNILFTVIYNLAGLSLAAVGLLPPAIAAAMQSIPDIGIMANSARLLTREEA
jgi:Cd2+/Zn2+-exporting ATPase/Cu+-exporting ATPase